MNTLKESADRKTAVRPNQRNTYGLLPGPQGSCPSATIGEGGCFDSGNPDKSACYVMRLMRIYKGVTAVLNYNTLLLRDAPSIDAMAELLVATFHRFAATKDAKNGCAYRIHWSGDIFDQRYAEALARAIKDTPEVQFWTYTRSFEYIKPLLNIPNLKLYLSVDPVNLSEGLKAYRALKKRRVRNTAVACMHEKDNIPAPIKNIKAAACPVDRGKMPLLYACHKCKICLKGMNVCFQKR